MNNETLMFEWHLRDMESIWLEKWGEKDQVQKYESINLLNCQPEVRRMTGKIWIF